MLMSTLSAALSFLLFFSARFIASLSKIICVMPPPPRPVLNAAAAAFAAFARPKAAAADAAAALTLGCLASSAA